MEIIPAILPKDFREIETKTGLVHGLAPFVQIDICDGKFVPSTTWPYKKHDTNFEEILNEQRGMPFWEDMDYEFDMMISNPTEEEMKKWLMTGAARIVLHEESSADLLPIMTQMKDLVEIGLALNIQTPIEALDKYTDFVTYVQLMGIGRIGYQGQEFDDRVLQKIRDVKAKYPHLAIQIDGGVSLETAGLIADAGADRIIVGSALFGQGYETDLEDLVDTYHQLEQI